MYKVSCHKLNLFVQFARARVLGAGRSRVRAHFCHKKFTKSLQTRIWPAAIGGGPAKVRPSAQKKRSSGGGEVLPPTTTLVTSYYLTLGASLKMSYKNTLSFP